jgi:hypothetical protein
MIGFGFSSIAFSGSDLDDGMSRYTDDSMSKYDGLGDKMINTRFITLKARSKADNAKKRKGCKTLEGYDNVSNSLVFAPGTDTRNLREVYNVQNKSGQSSAIGCK